MLTNAACALTNPDFTEQRQMPRDRAKRTCPAGNRVGVFMFVLTTALDYRSKATLFVHAHGAQYKAAGLLLNSLRGLSAVLCVAC